MPSSDGATEATASTEQPVEQPMRSKGATRVVDESIRDYPAVTEDEKLLATPTASTIGAA